MKFMYVAGLRRFNGLSEVIVNKFHDILSRIGTSQIQMASNPKMIEGTADIGFLHYPHGIAFADSKPRINALYDKMKLVCGEVFVYTGNLEDTTVEDCLTYGNSAYADVYCYPRLWALRSYTKPEYWGKFVYAGHRRTARVGRLKKMPGLSVLCGNSWWKDAHEWKQRGVEMLTPVKPHEVVGLYQKYAGGIHVTEKIYDKRGIVCARLWEIIAAYRPMILWPEHPIHMVIIKKAANNLDMSPEILMGNGMETYRNEHERASRAWRDAVIDAGIFMTDDQMEQQLRRISE